jgi:DNA-binding PadR family transcriptional regulator
MSPVFGHGRLRLYLLKLLDEAPRHGYEVIRLLQDRFMGVYAPSPGTIYPRLARLEEEGLLAHDDVDGRKVYRITDKGRDEIHRRFDELEDLEREITESVTDIAREVKEDVRETVRSLRDDLTWATREMHRENRRSAHDRARQVREEARERTRQVREQLRQDDDRAGAGGAGREDQREGAAGAGGSTGHGKGAGRDRSRDWWSGRSGTFGDWADWGGWGSWTGKSEWARKGRQGTSAFREFDRVARDFADELRKSVRFAGALGEDATADLREILDDAMRRIRDEILIPARERHERRASGPADSGPADDDDENPWA